MNNKFKKVIASVCIATSLFSVSAFALKLDYKLTMQPGIMAFSYSDTNPKNDTEQMAYITVSSISVPSNIVHAKVTDKNYNDYTTEFTITSTGSYKKQYTEHYATKSQPMRLGMQATTQVQTVIGRWNS